MTCRVLFSSSFFWYLGVLLWTSLVAQMVKHLPTMRETQVQSLGWEDLLEKENATHSSTLAWKIPWTEEPGRATVQGSQRVRHDFTFLTFLWSSLSTEQHLPLAAGLTSIHPSTKAVFLILFSCLCCVLLFCYISLRGLFFILCVTICWFPFCSGQFLELY